MEYTIDTENIKRTIDRYSRYGKVYYPLKTNAFPQVVDTIGNETNNRFLINDINHAKIIHAQYRNLRNSTHINTLNPLPVLLELYKMGVKSYVFDEYDKLRDFVDKIQSTSKLEVTIKIALSDICGIPVNTGATYAESQKMEDYLNRLGIPYGYSIYLNRYAKEMISMADCINHIHNQLSIDKARFISLGGLGDIDDSTQEKELHFISNKLGQVELRLEPGKSLVDKAISCKSSILAHKVINNGTEHIITIEGSVYKQFFDLAALNREFDFLRIESDNGTYNLSKTPSIDTIPIHIFGSSSDSNDYLGKLYISKDFKHQEGNKVIIKNVGAYFEVERDLR